MKRLYLPLLFVALATLCAGCTSNSLVVVNPRPADNRVVALRKAIVPCVLSADEKGKYSTVVPVLTANGQIPQQAKDNRVDGCAGIEFQLDASGHPINLNTFKESPVGYGFAEALQQKLTVETFKPPFSPSQWYYVTTAYVTSTMIAQ